MIRCGMLTVVLLFLFGLIWGGTFLWNRLTTDGEEQTFAGASVIEQPETFPKGKPRIMIDAGHGGKDHLHVRKRNDYCRYRKPHA